MLKINNLTPTVYFTSNHYGNDNSDTKEERFVADYKQKSDNEYHLRWKDISSQFSPETKERQEAFMRDVEEIRNKPIDITPYEKQLYEMMKIDPDGWRQLINEKPSEDELDWFKAQISRLKKECEKYSKQLEHYENERRRNYNYELYCCDDVYLNDMNVRKNEVRHYSGAARDTETLIVLNKIAQDATKRLHDAYEQYLQTGQIENSCNLLEEKDIKLLETSLQQ